LIEMFFNLRTTITISFLGVASIFQLAPFRTIGNFPEKDEL